MSNQSDVASTVSDAAGQVRTAAASSINDLKSQASQAADQAKGTLTTMASEARSRVNEMVDQQKTAGADQLSGIAKAAQNAAGELDGKNPQIAKLVRDAATSVDRFAGDLRERDIRDVLDTVSGFARQQPAAFFAGSVLIGFVLARFLKSEAPAAAPYAPDRSPI